MHYEILLSKYQYVISELPIIIFQNIKLNI